MFVLWLEEQPKVILTKLAEKKMPTCLLFPFPLLSLTLMLGL